jgi:hypothetical protein
MSDEIGFEDLPPKEVPEIIDEDVMKEKAIKSIEQKQATERAKAEMGIVEKPPAAESVPKDVPFLFFHYTSQFIECPAFEADDDECKLVARHLSIIIGSMNSRIWSIVVIALILLSKAVKCKTAIKNLFNKKNKLPGREQKDQAFEASL